MKSTVLLSILISTAFAAPATTSGDYEYGPGNTTINIIKSSGNGCPGTNNDIRTGVTGYMWGSHDDTPVWQYALNLPSTMGAAYFSDLPEEHTKTCTHEWQLSQAEGYRWNVNTNGTWIHARYILPEGMTATWKVTYYPTGAPEFTDTIVVNGPVNTVEHDDNLWMQYSAAPAKGRSFKTGCTAAEQVIKIKTKVSLTKDESKYTAGSASVWGGYNADVYARVMQGLTYDWEKC